MTFFAVIGSFSGYGICHWSDSTNWDYTASGHAMRLLAGFGNSKLFVSNGSADVSAAASSEGDTIHVLLWNHNGARDSIDLTVPMGSTDNYDYELWKMDADSAVPSLFNEATIVGSTVVYEPRIIYLPFPYIIDNCNSTTGDLIMSFPVDSNEIYYLKITRDGSAGIAAPHEPRAVELTVTPNPFNAACVIAVPAHATIEIFDINGLKVAEISVNNIVGDGSPVPSSNGHGGRAPTEIIWQPDKSVGSGVYLVRAIMGDESITKRVVYLK